VTNDVRWEVNVIAIKRLQEYHQGDGLESNANNEIEFFPKIIKTINQSLSMCDHFDVAYLYTDGRNATDKAGGRKHLDG
jgi:hypothetical protein